MDFEASFKILNEPLLPFLKIQLSSLGLFITCNAKVMLRKSHLGVMATDGS